MPGLLSLRNAPQHALMSSGRVQQAKRHANVAVSWTLAMSHARGLEALLRRGSVEAWEIDADMQPAILAWMGSYAGQAVIAAHDSWFQQLLSDLGDELLRVGPSLPHAFLRETCYEARLQVVPKLLPRDHGKV